MADTNEVPVKSKFEIEIVLLILIKRKKLFLVENKKGEYSFIKVIKNPNSSARDEINALINQTFEEVCGKVLTNITKLDTKTIGQGYVRYTFLVHAKGNPSGFKGKLFDIDKISSGKYTFEPEVTQLMKRFAQIFQ